MNNDLMSLWEKTLNIIKGEMSEVSFNTWIKSCSPISISSNTIKISVPNSFTQDILEKRYKDLIPRYHSAFMCTGSDYCLCFIGYIKVQVLYTV